MEESILISIKKLLGITNEYTHFDTDIIMHINSVFMVLQQIGVGPTMGFYIEDDSATWDEYINNPAHVHLVKSYIYLKVKLLFDPPANSSHMNAIEKQISEFEWRLNMAAELGQFSSSSSSDNSSKFIATLGRAIVGQLQLGHAGGSNQNELYKTKF